MFIFKMETKIIKALIFLLIWASTYAFDSVEVLSPNINILKSGYFKTEKKLTPQQAYTIAMQKPLLPLPQKALSQGYDSDAYWYVFEVRNNNFVHDNYLDLKHTVDEYASLYTFRNGKLLQTQQSGYALAPHERSVYMLPVRFELINSDSTILYLLKIESDTTRYAAFAFGSSDLLNQHWFVLYGATLIAFGVFFALFFYNGFLFLVIWDKTYLFYIIYTTGLVLYNVLDVGLASLFYDYVGNHISVNLAYLKMVELGGLLLFTIYFLQLPSRNPRLNVLLWSGFILLLIMSILYVFDIGRFVSIVLVYSGTYLLIAVGVISYRGGYKPALFYLIATGGGMVFVNLFFLMPLGIVPLTLLGLNLINFAIIWDMIMLSFALAYRIRLLQKENQDNKYLLMLQSRQNSTGELSGNIAHQWRSPLNELGSIWATLEAKLKYTQPTKEEILDSIDMSTKLLRHLSNTVEAFQSFFQNTKSTEVFSVNDEILRVIDFVSDSMKNNAIQLEYQFFTEVTLQGNANEFTQALLNLILNAKDALIESKTENPIITITLQNSIKGFSLEIADNGGGIKIEPIETIFDSFVTDKGHGSGIGLFMTKNIIEHKLSGKISASNHNGGALFRMEFKNV